MRVKEEEIRPSELIREYLHLCTQDIVRYFSDVARHDLPCVACGHEEQLFEFDKHGFSYATCQKCHTLYQTPRPLLVAFEHFYRDSCSSRYWSNTFFPAVAEARR